tara:strand:+ start:947 stop:1309 length:363 start_codon:yes stop_codon:yes gene_type:complete
MSFIYLKNDVNKINTPTWIKMNDDSFSKGHRKKFLDIYSGTFERTNRGYVWKQDVQDIELKPEKTTPKYIATHPNGIEEEVESITEFCREYDLNKTALYAILRGERRTHKGIKIRKGDDK